MRIVLATHNPDKTREIQAVLVGIDAQVIPLREFKNAPEPVEDGETLEANAMIKARAIREFTGLSALADDTGLEVDALDGRPGIYAARYAGETATYEDNCRKLLGEMKDVPKADRSARFRTVMVLALTEKDAKALGGSVESVRDDAGGARVPDATADVLIADGILPGEIVTEMRGEGGFGYDPVFLDSRSKKTLSEMTSEEKNRTSHRYRALVEMRELMLRVGLVTRGEE